MAANEKVVYATDHTTHSGRYFKPGDQLTGHLSPEAVRHAQEGGIATESHADAERARAREAERAARVSREIETRSERRESDKQHGQRVVQMPDGSFRLAE